MLVHAVAKYTLHRAVQPDALANVARHAVLCAQLDGLEPQNIFRIEKHVLDNGPAFFALSRVPRKHNLFENNTIRIRAHGGAASS